MIIIVGISCAIATLLLLVRLILGPSLSDRALAVNAFGTVIVVMLCGLSLLPGNEALLDIALIYGLISFVGVLALLHYLEKRGG